jgi:hypothetical protein
MSGRTYFRLAWCCMRCALARCHFVDHDVSGQEYFTFLGHRIARREYLAIPVPTTGSNVWMVEGF